MPRSVVGLLAAVGAALSAIIGLSRGSVVWILIVSASAATGLAAYLALPLIKKSEEFHVKCSRSVCASDGFCQEWA
jgi:hypothetical protein